jgi:hypothetical protein
MSCPTIRRLKSAADSPDAEALLESVSAANLYTIPAVGATSMADDRTRSALDYQHKWFGRRTRAGVQHAKLVTTRLIKLDVGGELA